MNYADRNRLVEAAEAALRPRLTREFLEVLTLAVRTCGWGGDMIETSAFAAWCHELVGEPTPPDILKPIDPGPGGEVGP